MVTGSPPQRYHVSTPTVGAWLDTNEPMQVDAVASGMKFLWPDALWLLLAIAVVAGSYALLIRRRSKCALRYASLTLMRSAVGPRTSFRRHVPPLLLLIGLAATIGAIARPSGVLVLPGHERTVVLAIDTSLSMRATDVEPSRIVAAREAAKAFVRQRPEDVRIGIIAFSESAFVVQPPTRDQPSLIAAIDRLEPHGHTAIGTAMVEALSLLFPREDIVAQSDSVAMHFVRYAVSVDERAPKKVEPHVVPAGSYRAAAVILLTDGRRTVGPDPLDVAKLAADHGVRVFTVGFGKPTSDGPIGARAMNLEFDEPTLRTIADVTRADYFFAPGADELKAVYATLTTRFVLERERIELSALAVAVGAVFVIAAGLLSLLWFGRID